MVKVFECSQCGATTIGHPCQRCSTPILPTNQDLIAELRMHADNWRSQKPLLANALDRAIVALTAKNI